MTIAIELGIALLFGLRSRRVFRFIVIVNIITQVALNIFLSVLNYHMGFMMFVVFYVLFEIIVFIIEAIVYVAFLKNEVSKLKLIIYAFVANLVSIILGMALAFWIPWFF